MEFDKRRVECDVIDLEFRRGQVGFHCFDVGLDTPRLDLQCFCLAIDA